MLRHTTDPLRLAILYHQWYTHLLIKARHLILQKPAAPAKTDRFHQVGQALSAWEELYRHQVTSQWVAGLRFEQAEAVYHRLYKLAVEVFELVRRHNSCGPAYEKAVAFTPDKLREELRHFNLPPFERLPSLQHYVPPSLDVHYLSHFGQAWLTSVSKLYRTLTSFWLFGNTTRCGPAAQSALLRWREQMQLVLSTEYLEALSRPQAEQLTRYLDLTLFDEAKVRVLGTGLDSAVTFILQDLPESRVAPLPHPPVEPLLPLARPHHSPASPPRQLSPTHHLPESLTPPHHPSTASPAPTVLPPRSLTSPPLSAPRYVPTPHPPTTYDLSSGTIDPRMLAPVAAWLGSGNLDDVHAGLHSLGSQPRIAKRIGRKYYGVDAREWEQERERREEEEQREERRFM
ncbi:hypothetical protein JCM10908_002695 [Rhodotorula pacifica]|uniref:uncharacterized protein n=1 Tax=Rhodotorula pacifica TaxID=1495444 RepID=UPI00317EC38F